MIDSEIVKLVRALDGGELSAAEPLLVRLEANCDLRRHPVADGLARLFAVALAVEDAGGADALEPGACRNDWRMFREALAAHFWAELSGSIPGALARIEAAVRPAASRSPAVDPAETWHRHEDPVTRCVRRGA